MARLSSPSRDPSRSSDQSSQINSKLSVRPRTPPPVTPIYFPSEYDCSPETGEPCHKHHLSCERMIMGHISPVGHFGGQFDNHLERLWVDLRHEKEKKVANAPAKVESFVAGQLALVKISSHDRLNKQSSSGSGGMESDPASNKHSLKKRRSHTNFRESSDGRTITATFDMTGIKKQDVHISYQRTRLVVNWQTVKVSEREEGNKLVRERKEKKYDRILPLPEGTRYEEIHASMDGKHLTLTYPNIHHVVRSVRAKSRDRTRTEPENW